MESVCVNWTTVLSLQATSLSLSLSKINFLKPEQSHGAGTLSAFFVDKVYEYWRHEETVQAKFGLIKQVTVCHGSMSKSHCLLKIILEGRLGMRNLLVVQISE